MPDVRKIAFDVLYRVFFDDAYSVLLLNKAIKDNKLNRTDSGFLTNLVYGVLERKILVDYIISQYSKIKLKKLENKTLLLLELGIYQMLFMEKVPNSAAVNETVKLAKKVGAYKSSGYINALLRNFERNNLSYTITYDEKSTDYLSIKYSCPTFLIEMWSKQYGFDNTVKILDSLADRPPLNIRVNTLKTSKDELALKLESAGVCVENIDYLPDALSITNTGAIDELDAFNQGLFYVQDTASQLCCELSGAQEGMTVCDVCSAPGGKSIYTAIKMKNHGSVYSYDLYEHKIKLIEKSADRLGVDIIKASVRDALDTDTKAPLCDIMLCDVPCSGFGIIRRKPEIRYKKATIIDNLPSLQYSILCNNADSLSIGGVLVYSTCTLCDKENIDIVNRFLSEHPEFQPESLDLPSGIERYIDEPDNVITLLPIDGKTDGFFIAKFRKVGL